MRKFLFAAAIPLAVLSTVALAHSHEWSRGERRAAAHWNLEGDAPQPINEVRRGAPATIVGTVVETGRKTLVVADETGRTSVRLHRFDAASIEPGQSVTVIGWMGENGMRAARIVSQDGTVIGGGRHHRGDRRRGDCGGPERGNRA